MKLKKFDEVNILKKGKKNWRHYEEENKKEKEKKLCEIIDCHVLIFFQIKI